MASPKVNSYINITLRTNSMLVWGATYAVKEQINALGGIWIPNENLWKLPLLDSVAVLEYLNAELKDAKAKAVTLAKAQAQMLEKN